MFSKYFKKSYFFRRVCWDTYLSSDFSIRHLGSHGVVTAQSRSSRNQPGLVSSSFYSHRAVSAPPPKRCIIVFLFIMETFFLCFLHTWWVPVTEGPSCAYVDGRRAGRGEEGQEIAMSGSHVRYRLHLGTGCAWCWSQVLRTQDALGMNGPSQPGTSSPTCSLLIASELGWGGVPCWSFPWRQEGGEELCLPGQAASQVRDHGGRPD